MDDNKNVIAETQVEWSNHKKKYLRSGKYVVNTSYIFFSVRDSSPLAIPKVAFA